LTEPRKLTVQMTHCNSEHCRVTGVPIDHECIVVTQDLIRYAERDALSEYMQELADNEYPRHTGAQVRSYQTALIVKTRHTCNVVGVDLSPGEAEDWVSHESDEGVPASFCEDTDYWDTDIYVHEDDLDADVQLYTRFDGAPVRVADGYTAVGVTDDVLRNFVGAVTYPAQQRRHADIGRLLERVPGIGDITEEQVAAFSDRLVSFHHGGDRIDTAAVVSSAHYCLNTILVRAPGVTDDLPEQPAYPPLAGLADEINTNINTMVASTGRPSQGFANMVWAAAATTAMFEKYMPAVVAFDVLEALRTRARSAGSPEFTCVTAKLLSDAIAESSPGNKE
jgi:hypothetical protein